MTPDDRLRLALLRAAATDADELWLLALADRLAAEVERMRPVCEAAAAYGNVEISKSGQAMDALLAALAAYRATLPRPAAPGA